MLGINKQIINYLLFLLLFYFLNRDPDFYQYRILKLPDDLTKAPHSGKSQDIILAASEHGHYIPRKLYIYDNQL